MRLIQYIKDQITEPIVIPDIMTKEDFVKFCKDCEKYRTKGNFSYFPITPEMNSVMLRMIDQLPDGGYVIKTER